MVMVAVDWVHMVLALTFFGLKLPPLTRYDICLPNMIPSFSDSVTGHTHQCKVTQIMQV